MSLENIGFLITARLKSTRLPKKLLLPLGNSTVVENVIERVKSIRPSFKKIVVCTSLNSQDDPLEELAIKHGVECFRGSEEDVFDRLVKASEKYMLEGFVSITGENPFFSRSMAHQTRVVLESGDFDLVMTVGLPRGCAVMGVKVSTAYRVNEIKLLKETEMWRPFLDQPQIFKVKKLHATFAQYGLPDNLRLTIDYPQDYELFKRILDRLETEEMPSLHSVLKTLSEDKDLLKLNEDCQQAELPPDKAKAISEFFADPKVVDQLRQNADIAWK